MIRRPPRSTQSRSSAASDVYKRQELNQERGTTILMVLHDLNMAARYCDQLIAMRAGKIVAAGSPAEVVTAANMRQVFGINARVIADPTSGAPLVLPIGRHRV